jgi:tRNA(fMet)-specific endonuclease VapC
VKYLFDTNTLSALATNKSRELNKKFVSASRVELCTCDVVWHEVEFGLAANESIALKLRPIFEILFSGLTLLSMTRPIWLRAAAIRVQLKKRGTPVGPHDLLIAATALEHNLILVTHNLSEFEKIKGLVCESWL